MSSIAKNCVDNPVLTIIIFALLGMIGLFSLRSVPISLYPDMDEPVLCVIATYESAGPESRWRKPSRRSLSKASRE